MIAMLSASLAADEGGGCHLAQRRRRFAERESPPATSALFAGDSVQTQSKSAARIEITGSVVDINSDTVIQFESDEIRLDSRQFVSEHLPGIQSPRWL
jgi:hypothetical protein